MPGIIDSLVVTLGLDSSNYTRNSKNAREDLAKTRDVANKSNAEIERKAKNVAQAYGNIASEIKGVVLAVAGVQSVASFVTALLGNNAALGHFSNNLGTSAKDLFAWQQAVKSVGGSAEEAIASIQTLVGIRQNRLLRGDMSKDADLQGLGITYQDMQDPQAVLRKLAQRSQTMSGAEFSNRAGALGLPQNMINLLEKGPSSLDQTLDKYRAAAPTDKDVKAAQDLQGAFTDLSTKLRDTATPALTDFINGLLTFKNWMDGKESGITSNVAGWLKPLNDKVDGWISHNLLDRDPKHPNLGGAVANWLLGPPGSTGAGATSGITPLRNIGGANAPLASSGGKGAVALAGNNTGGINNGKFAASQPGYVGANGRYAAFDTQQHGLDAHRALLRSYIRRGYDTPAKLAPRWAPAGDGRNNPAVYAANIARQLGIGVNDRITPAMVDSFSIAQAKQENGRFGGTLQKARAATASSGVSSAAPASNTTSTSVGQIVVYTPATDGAGVARDLGQSIQRRGLVTQANSGLQQ